MDKQLMTDIIVSTQLPSILTRLDKAPLEDAWLCLSSLRDTNQEAYERFVEVTLPGKAIFHKLVINFVDPYHKKHGLHPTLAEEYKETLEDYKTFYKTLID